MPKVVSISKLGRWRTKSPTGKSSAPPVKESDTKANQDELFLSADSYRGMVTFIDEESLDQDRLLRIIAACAINCILDIRPKPVFQSPRFNHKAVTSYLTDMKVRYYHLYPIVSGAHSDGLVVSNPSSSLYRDEWIEFDSGVSVSLLRGLVLVIYSSESGADAI